MTTKTYQSVLPGATRKPCRRDSLVRSIKTRLTDLFANGFWFCHDHEGRCERVEGEQGQPAHCDVCGSPRLEWNPPIWSGQIEDSKIIEPRDFTEKEAA